MIQNGILAVLLQLHADNYYCTDMFGQSEEFEHSLNGSQWNNTASPAEHGIMPLDGAHEAIEDDETQSKQKS